MTQASSSGAMFGPSSANPATSGHEPANLGDILERVLDRGIVIVGDIRVSLLDIELLTLKLRLVVASVDTARQMGIDWWEHDPWLTSRARGALPAGDAGAEALEADAAAEAIESGTAARERRDDTHPAPRQARRG
jgi:Gas vesicle protein